MGGPAGASGSVCGETSDGEGNPTRIVLSLLCVPSKKTRCERERHFAAMLNRFSGLEFARRDLEGIVKVESSARRGRAFFLLRPLRCLQGKDVVRSKSAPFSSCGLPAITGQAAR